MNPSRLRYYQGTVNIETGASTSEMQEIQRDAITESVSTSYILACADSLTNAEAKALNNPGRKVPFEVQCNHRKRATYYVECLR